MKRGRSIVVLAAAIAASGSFAAAEPVGSSITYQGKLQGLAGPVADSCDFEFSLWDSVSSGSQIGTTQEVTLNVEEGLFTAHLDFGDGAFDGNGRYLEIIVACGSDAAFTLLTPRQKFNPAPYAVRAVTGVGGPNTLNVTPEPDSRVGIATTSPQGGGQLDVRGDMFMGGGSGRWDGPTEWLNIRGRSAGWYFTVENQASADDTGFFISPDNLPPGAIYMQRDGDVGIGTSDPQAKLHIGGTAGVDGLMFPDGTLQTTAGGGGGGDGLPAGCSSGQVAKWNGSTWACAGDNTGGGGGGNTLDQAYDEGGPGAGRKITVDSGRIEIIGTGECAPFHVETSGSCSAITAWNTGTNGGTGIRGVTFAANSTGVYGSANNASSFAGWFAGRSYFSGDVGIGTTSPAGKLHVDAGSATFPVYVERSGDGGLIVFSRNGALSGSITVSGGTVSYNEFTGSHLGWTDDAINRGVLVSMTGQNRYHSDLPESEVVYGITPATSANDSRCMGAYLGLEDPNAPHSNTAHLVMAVGNGDMWVVDTGKDIAPGNYLISSDVTGHAMLDDSERFPIGYVVARAAEPVTWDNESDTVGDTKHKKVSVFFESFVRGSGTEVRKLVDAQRMEITALQSGVTELKARLQTLEKSKTFGASFSLPAAFVLGIIGVTALVGRGRQRRSAGGA